MARQRRGRQPGKAGTPPTASSNTPPSDGDIDAEAAHTANVVSVVVLLALFALTGGFGLYMYNRTVGSVPPAASSSESLEELLGAAASLRQLELREMAGRKPEMRWKPVDIHLHDVDAFTQGLEFHDGFLWESTGLYGESTMRKVDVTTGAVFHTTELDPSLFGEGITRVNDTMLQLTWREGVVLRWKYPDLTLIDSVPLHSHTGEGWGVCYDGHRLIVADGSDVLTFLDCSTLARTGEVHVVDPATGEAQGRLNELECVDGEVLANVWYKDEVVRIDPDSGHVVGRLDFTALYPWTNRGQHDVMNGIAYDPAGSSEDSKRLFLTGKKWRRTFEVRWFPPPRA